MKRTLSFALLLCLITSSATFSQIAEQISSKQEIKNGHHVKFKNGNSSVSEYLNANLSFEIEKIQYKRGVFKLVIDHEGSVNGATLIYGGLTESIENQTISAFFKMPKWETSIDEKKLAIVYVVVTIKDGKLSTEIY